MDKFTRKDLKTDRFAERVGSTVEYVAEHRAAVLRYSVIGLVVLVALIGLYLYRHSQQLARQQQLRDAMRIHQAAVGPVPNEFMLSFPTEEEKKAATEKAFNQIITDHAGTKEAAAAQYMLGVAAADEGNQAEAERNFRTVVDSGHADYASLGALALAEIYAAQGKTADAEKLLRPLIDKPTMLVSREQAIIALAQALASSNPAEARKLLEPLRTERSAVSRAALNVLGELPAN
ncbi:MAG: tetratricopeptide repeat protein [Bryobacteraceae bacterium]